jgi:hypothetical protein
MIIVVVILWLLIRIGTVIFEPSATPDRASRYFCIGVDAVGVGNDDCDVWQGNT